MKLPAQQVADPLCQLNWEALGKAATPDISEVAAAEASSANTYGALTTPGPAVTAVRAGVYIIRFGATIEATLTAGWRGRVSIDGTDAHSAVATGSGSAGAASQGGSVSRDLKMTLTAGQTLTCTYRSDAANSVTFSNRFLSITPIG